MGDMHAMGATAPVTLAGAVTLNLAEQLAYACVERILFGEQQLRLGGSISVMDMRTTIYPYGRPEMALANLMIAQLARHYGACYSGHAGLSDAKLPSVESGAQKALTAIPTLMACGSLWMDVGLLSTDEVCSPIQLVLDDEFLGCLSRFAHEFEISDGLHWLGNHPRRWPRRPLPGQDAHRALPAGGAMAAGHLVAPNAAVLAGERPWPTWIKPAERIVDPAVHCGARTGNVN